MRENVLEIGRGCYLLLEAEACQSLLRETKKKVVIYLGWDLNFAVMDRVGGIMGQGWTRSEKNEKVASDDVNTF